MPAIPGSMPASIVARLATDKDTAERIVDAVAASFETLAAVAGASENVAGRWAVAIHFQEPPNETAVRALVGLEGGAEAANALTFKTVAPADWVAASLAGLAPVAAGRFVVHGAHDRGRIPVNRIGIEIEAALAFGTGHHGTTRGCLIALEGIAKRGRQRNILDLGTGTGVLAIAAALALHRPVLASDIDPVAIRTARVNANYNRAGAAVAIVHAGGVEVRHLRVRAPYDLVFANILLRPLQRFASPLAKLVSPGARIVLSGLLRSQESAALAAYRLQGFALTRRIALDEWVTLVLSRAAGRRRANPASGSHRR
jgi:ribosomal protein L11 methyltransferase